MAGGVSVGRRSWIRDRNLANCQAVNLFKRAKYARHKSKSPKAKESHGIVHGGGEHGRVNRFKDRTDQRTIGRGKSVCVTGSGQRTNLV